MGLPLACWCVNMWVKYMSARLPFNLILEILPDKIHIFKAICCLHLEYRIQFEHWWFLFSVLNKSAFDRYGKQGCTPWFEFCCANILVLLNCKSSFFSDWRKSQGKNNLKGKMKDQTAAALIILTGDVRLLKWEKKWACCFLAPSIRPITWKWILKSCWILMFQLG